MKIDGYFWNNLLLDLFYYLQFNTFLLKFYE